MTSFLHRLLIVVPANAQTQMNLFFKTQVDPEGGDRTFLVGYSPSGSAPITHYAACISLGNVELKRIFGRLAQQSGITQPADWDSYSRPQKKKWLQDNLVVIRARTGIILAFDDNDGVWTDYAAVLAQNGLKPVRPQGI